MKSTRSLLLLASALVTFACGGRYLGEYEDYGVGLGDGDGDGDYYPGDGDYYPGDGDYYPGDGDYYPGDGDYYPGDGDYYPGDGDYYPGDGDGTIDPPPPDPTAPAGSCQNPLVLTTTGARGNSGSGWNRFSGPCPGNGDEMVYQFVAPQTGSYSFDTVGSTFDTTLHLTTEPCGGFVVTCNDDYYQLQSLVSTELQEGQVVYLILQSFDENVQDYTINVNFYDVPGPDPGAPEGSCENPRLLTESGARGDGGSGRDDYSGPCSGDGDEMVYAFVAPEDGVYSFDTSGSNFDTTLHLMTEACSGLLIDCNDDYYGLQSLVSTELRAGETAYLILQSFERNFVDYLIHVTRYIPTEPTACPDANLSNTLGAPLLVQEVDIPPNSGGVGSNACGGGPALANYSWTAPASANYVFSTSGSDFDTVLTLRETCGGSMINCNDDARYETSRLEEYVEAGQSLIIEISAYGGYPYIEDPELGGPTAVLSIWED